MDISEEHRAELTDEIVGVLMKETIVFHHEDTTEYPDSVEMEYDGLLEGKLFNYDLGQDDIDWIIEVKTSLNL